MTRPSEAKRRALVEPSLFDPPTPPIVQVTPQTRHDDPCVSERAAQKAAITARSRAYRLLCVFEDGQSWTADEAAVNAQEPIYEARKRISDLIRLGLIRDTGFEGQSIAGNEARLLAITFDGRSALHVARTK